MHYSKIIIRENFLGIVRWLGTSISPIYPSFDGLLAYTGNSLRPRPLGGTKNKDIKHLHQNFCIDLSWSVGPTVPFLSELGSPFNPKKTKGKQKQKNKKPLLSLGQERDSRVLFKYQYLLNLTQISLYELVIII